MDLWGSRVCLLQLFWLITSRGIFPRFTQKRGKIPGRQWMGQQNPREVDFHALPDARLKVQISSGPGNST